MKMITAFFTLILIPLVASTSSAKTLVFSEEFNSPINYSTDPSDTTTKWYVRNLSKGWGVLGTGSCAMANNFTVENGMGVITMREETQICGGVSHQWTSAEISTLSRFGFTHGYIEARVKVPQGRGLFSAFWTYSKTWAPNMPEHDIFEFPLGNNPAYMTYHYTYEGTQYMDQSEVTIPNFTDWHVYSLTWEPGLLIWKVDGVEHKRHEGATVPETDGEVAIFFTMYAGANWFNEYPDKSTNLPQSMYIDWVRVWDSDMVKRVVPSPPAQLKILK